MATKKDKATAVQTTSTALVLASATPSGATTWTTEGKGPKWVLTGSAFDVTSGPRAGQRSFVVTALTLDVDDVQQRVDLKDLKIAAGWRYEEDRKRFKTDVIGQSASSLINELWASWSLPGSDFETSLIEKAAALLEAKAAEEAAAAAAAKFFTSWLETIKPNPVLAAMGVCAGTIVATCAADETAATVAARASARLGGAKVELTPSQVAGSWTIAYKRVRA
jgi:hypothetical protein